MHIVKQFKANQMPLDQVNGQVTVLLQARPDISTEFSAWSKQWAASGGTAASVANPAGIAHMQLAGQIFPPL